MTEATGWIHYAREMEPLPDDYGVAWYEPHRMIAVCMPAPFHRIAGWLHRWWEQHRMAVTPSLLDDAYQRGLEAGRQMTQARLDALRVWNEQQKRDTYERGWQEGQAAYYAAIMADLRQRREGDA